MTSRHTENKNAKKKHTKTIATKNNTKEIIAHNTLHKTCTELLIHTNKHTKHSRQQDQLHTLLINSSKNANSYLTYCY